MRRASKSTQRLAVIGIVLIILVSIFAVFSIAQSPRRQAQKQATNIAEQKVGLKDPTRFYWFDRDKTYYTVEGKNKQNQTIDVIIAQKTGNITVVNQQNGWSRNQALTKVWDEYHPKKVLNINLGLYHNQPAWDIAYLDQKGNLNYLLLSFKNGHEINLIKNA
ncbi:MAG: DUF5590 domain-containing protein [Candidatus Paralactobacillus gallistercoris]|uniref:DUF5590 domain-containing protein n=1 Tax=Candidatus Paralactobacillus gallistercoris TaxID=2838724 RepID=A0A948X386_9LACO|nr:DUF5590 domain-containing protein [Candidatus Paralactobacillus gallistercoris]